MSSFYAMQRANGKWFTVKDNESIRVPIFSSNSEAMQARARTRGMMFFRPVVFDERALKALVSIKEITVCFWLVSNPKTDVKHGKPLTSEQLAELFNKERNKQKDSSNV
jgi:hypothetical protein